LAQNIGAKGAHKTLMKLISDQENHFEEVTPRYRQWMGSNENGESSNP